MSEVALCNQSLTILGGELIQSFGDGTKEANLCSTHYASCRDAVQEAHDWSFNRARDELTADATAPVYGYDNRYQAPAEALTIRQVTLDPQGRVDVDRWAFEGRWILADAGDTVFVRYNQRITDVAQFTPLFEQALVAYLAATLATALAESPSLANQQMQLYMAKVNDAASVDGLQGRNEATFGGRHVRARWSGGAVGRYGLRG